MVTNITANVRLLTSNWQKIEKAVCQSIHATSLLREDANIFARRKDRISYVNANLVTPWRKTTSLVKKYIYATRNITTDVNIYAKNVDRKPFANVRRISNWRKMERNVHLSTFVIEKIMQDAVKFVTRMATKLGAVAKKDSSYCQTS